MDPLKLRRVATVVSLAAVLFLLAAAPASASDSVSVNTSTATLSKGPGDQTITLSSVTYNCVASGTGTPDLNIVVDQLGGQTDALAVGDVVATCDGVDHTLPITATQISKRKFHGGEALANLTIYPCGFGCAGGTSSGDVTIQLVR